MKCGGFLVCFGFFNFFFYFFILILSFCKSALFDSQRCQIAGCKKKVFVYTYSNILRLTHLCNTFCL